MVSVVGLVNWSMQLANGGKTPENWSVSWNQLPTAEALKHGEHGRLAEETLKTYNIIRRHV